MGKSTTERYYPGNLPDTPEALIPFLFDELWRIANSLQAHIVGCTVTQTQLSVATSPTPTEAPLFIGGTIKTDLPGGGFNVVTGAYTAPETGLYTISVDSVVAPFGSGNKIYNCDLRIYVAGVLLWRSVDSGDDDQELGTSIAVGARVLAGQAVTCTITIKHDQFTGSVLVDSYLSINQTSAE